MSSPMEMLMTLQESDGELVFTLETPTTVQHPTRRVLRYPNRLIACQHLHQLGLFSAEAAADLLALDLSEQVLCFPILIRDPKVQLRGFMPYPMHLVV